VTSGIKLLPFSNATCQGGGEDRLERVALPLPNPSVDGAVSAGAVINLSPWRGVATGISTDVPALCTWALQPCRRWMGSSKMLTPWNPSQCRRSNPTCGGPLCARWCLVGKEEESAHRHPRGGGSLHSCRGGEGGSGSLVPAQRRRRRRIRGRQHGRWRGEVGEAKGDDTKEGKGTGQNVIDRGRSGTRMRPAQRLCMGGYAWGG
jgi:hypothetical protein